MGIKDQTPATMDMTPMIDCVFQLMIFFILTIKMESDYNKEIELEYGKNGPLIEKVPPTETRVEVDRRGVLSIHNAKISQDQFRQHIQNKMGRLKQPFPVRIRADKRTQHKDVRKVMDICADEGIARINFEALKEMKNK